jgi:hypothetical protein
VHYNTDDVFAAGNWFWLHRAGIRLYDIHLTTNRWNVREIRESYGVRTMRVGMGFDREYHRPPSSARDREPATDVVFVGHWEPHTERYIAALRDVGVSVEVWGFGWRKARDRSLRTVMPLGHGEYVGKVASAKIALCSLSRRNRNESTGRSFEIPSIGTFLLAERTAEHEYLYGDGSGAALFTGEQELVDKALYYLDREEERLAVAARGHARCLALGLSWGDHMRREWSLLCDILRSGTVPGGRDTDIPFWPGFRRGEVVPAGACKETGTVVKGSS